MSEAKNCVSCGMPLRTPADYPLGDATKGYCCHCARPDGSLQSYEERLAGMAGFLSRSRGLDEGVALEMARSLMAELPAWKGRAG